MEREIYERLSTKLDYETFIKDVYKRQVCKLTTYTDIGKMGLANLFFVPPT